MKISCTYTSIITANIFFVLFLVPMLLYIKRQKDIFHKKEIKMVVICFLFLVVRLFVPLEFPITYSVYITNIYAGFCEILRDRQIGNINIMILLFVINICGTVIISIVKILQYRRFSRLLSYGKVIRYIHTDNIFGKTIKIPIKQIKYMNEVFIVGLIRPTIILPENLVGNEEYIIQHELQHFKNHDLWYKLLVNILCVIYWWNPLTYVLQRYISNILELRNDFSVVENMSEKEKITYVDNILLFAKEGKKMKVGLGLNKNLSKTRIYSLLYEKNRKTIKFYLIVIILLVFSFFIIIEPRGALELKNGEFTLRGSNSYLMKEKEGYGVYINGEFIGDIKEIPKELSGLKILK